METITATTKASMFFRSNTAGVNGRRFPAGTTVTLSENRKGQLVASILDTEHFGLRYTAQLSPSCVAV